MKKKTFLLEALCLLLRMNFSTIVALNDSSCFISNKKHLVCNYIPKTIPDGVVSVHIKDFLKKNVDFEIHTDLFLSDSWKSVKYLEFSKGQGRYSTIRIQNSAFSLLSRLNALKIYTNSLILLDPESLLGLDNLRTLDFSRCFRLGVDNLTAALNGSEKVPNLEQLYLSKLQMYFRGFKVDEKFYGSLMGKPLRVLDLSGTHMTLLELAILPALNGLEVVNISRATVDHFGHDMLKNFSLTDYSHIHLLDLNNMIPTDLLPPSAKRFVIANLHAPVDLNIILPFSPYILNMTGVNKDHTISIYNTKVWFPKKQKLWSRHIIATDNLLHRADLDIDCSNCDFTSLQQLDIARNNLEFIHPSITRCFPNIENMDVSGNRLYIMYEENVELFWKLLRSSERLMSINLASNNLTDLPKDFFENNLNLTSINLKDNRFTQIHFKLFHLKQLSLLDISYNNVKLLDLLSLRRLDEFSINAHYQNVHISEESGDVNRKIKLSGNPFICDSCYTLSSIRWLTITITTSIDELTCLGENGKVLKMSNAVNEVQEICNRKTMIVTITVTSVYISFIVVTAFFLIRRRMKDELQEKRRNIIIEHLRDDDESFAIFVSCCNNDVEFVLKYIFEPLNKSLQKIIGTERNLVCIGDSEYDLGKPFISEFMRCLDLSTVFVPFVSDNYRISGSCELQLNQAVEDNKPMVLMMKRNIEIDLMSSTMQMVSRHKTKIVWEKDGDDLKIDSTWDNVCNSILDIAAN
ncbi:hypothetical protein ACF0H5_021881 [Mactra antiquata]